MGKGSAEVIGIRSWGGLPAALALILAACGEGTERGETPRAQSTNEAQAGTGSTNVSLVLANWSVTADPESVPAGTVTFVVQVKNDAHALSILRTDLPADQLPTFGAANVDINDELVELVAHEGPWDETGSGSPVRVEVQLKPGAYALICNLGGHYARGMRTGFEVA